MWKKLLALARKRATEAKALLESEDPQSVKRGEELLVEAEGLRKRAEGIKAAEGIADGEDGEEDGGDDDGNGDDDPLDLTEEQMKAITEQIGTKAFEAVMEKLGKEPPATKAGFVTGDEGAGRLSKDDQAALKALGDYFAGRNTPEVKALKATIQADQDIGGGYLVAPESFVTQLIQAMDNLTFVRQMATVHQLDRADSLGVPTLETDMDDAVWTSELATGSEDTAIEFGKRALFPHPLAKRVKVSKTLIRRSRMNVVDIVMERLSYKFGVTQENAYMVGSGANQPLGVFTASANGISTGRDITSGAALADVLEADDFITMKYELKQQYLSRAVWVMHRDVAEVVRKLKDGEGQYLWREGAAGEGIATAAPPTILGRPVHLSEYAPNTVTASQYICIFGDFKFYWIADALDMQVQTLLELYAETNQNGYIGRLESDGMPVLEEAFVRLKTAAA